MLTDAQESSKKTSFRGSSVGCFCRNAARAAATSGHFCSEAQSVVLIADPQALQKPTHRRHYNLDDSRIQLLMQYEEGGARRLIDDPHDGIVLGRSWLHLAAKSPARKLPRRLNALHQLDHETHADAELANRFAARTYQIHGAKHKLAEIIGIRIAIPPRSTGAANRLRKRNRKREQFVLYPGSNHGFSPWTRGRPCGRGSCRVSTRL